MSQKYSVGFLEGDIVREVITIHAKSKEQAFAKAEEVYKSLGFTFGYTDMFADLLRG